MQAGKREGNLPSEQKAPALMKDIAILFAFIWLMVND